jgi:hypothetical protein
MNINEICTYVNVGRYNEICIYREKVKGYLSIVESIYIKKYNSMFKIIINFENLSYIDSGDGGYYFHSKYAKDISILISVLENYLSKPIDLWININKLGKNDEFYLEVEEDVMKLEFEAFSNKVNSGEIILPKGIEWINNY